MFVSKSMSKNVVTISKDAGVVEARNVMTQNGFRHLPVVDDQDHLIGIITDRDIRSAMPFDRDQSADGSDMKDARVETAMSTSPRAVSPIDTIQDVLLLFQQNRVGAFPVVDDQNRVIGVISVRDLLRAFTNVLGIGEPGVLLCIVVEEKVGQLKRIVDAITEEGISLGSILVARHWDEDKRAVFPYLLTLNVGGVKNKLKKMGFTLMEPLDWTLEQ
jgi:acetoin utilization protein AcuB